MRYLILGGAGFIGSHLVDYLLDKSEYNHVRVIDNFQTGSFENIEHHLDNPRFRFNAGDITNEYMMDDEDQKTTHVIINLACPASPIDYQADPIGTLLTCTRGTYNGLCLARSTKARFLQASTSEVYGNPTVHPQPESYWGHVNSYGPRACYDEGKRCAEAFVYEFNKLGVDTRVVRIFNTYGPRMAVDDGRVVSNFITQALKGEPITIYGTGEQTRSLCYVDDLIQGLITVMINGFQTPVNIGNPVEITMNELARTVITLTKSSSRIIHLDLPKDDPERRKPDISKARSLGWEPKVSLEEGLKRTIEHFRKALDHG